MALKRASEGANHPRPAPQQKSRNNPLLNSMRPADTSGGFEAVFVAIFTYFVGVPDAAAHGYPGTGGQCLHGTDGATDIENGIGVAESCGVQGAGQDHGFVRDVCQL